MTEAKLISGLNEENLSHFSKTYVPSRLLLGPGPSNAHPDVLKALSLNPIGHLDEAYISLMSDVQTLLRYAWQCNNRITLPMSGTGSAAMEASIANFIEEGERILIAKKGYFGDRLVDMAKSIHLLNKSGGGGGGKFTRKYVRDQIHKTEKLKAIT